MCLFDELAWVGRAALMDIEKRIIEGDIPAGYVATADPSVFPASNHFVKTGGIGIYIRELPIPKGVFMSGHKHRTDHVCMLLKGRLRLHVDGQTSEIGAGKTFVAQAGGQKAVEALEDSIFVTLHATDTTDLKALEDELIEKSQQYLDYEKQGRIA